MKRSRWDNFPTTKHNQLFQIADDSIIDDSYNESMAYSELMRHSTTISIIYCIAYTLVFSVGLVGNLFVISVVFRVPRMRTVTNLFIANLAIADVLVIVFCVPATLMSNLFVRKYQLRVKIISILYDWNVIRIANRFPNWRVLECWSWEHQTLSDIRIDK